MVHGEINPEYNHDSLKMYLDNVFVKVRGNQMLAIVRKEI